MGKAHIYMGPMGHVVDSVGSNTLCKGVPIKTVQTLLAVAIPREEHPAC